MKEKKRHLLNAKMLSGTTSIHMIFWVEPLRYNFLILLQSPTHTMIQPTR